MMNVKITKRENYETLRDLLAEACRDELITAEESERLDEFLAHEIEQLDKRAESAKKYAEKKKTDTDPIAEAVETVLTEADHALSLAEIVEQIPADLNASAQKVTYRLTQLVKAEKVVKTSQSFKVEGKGSRKVTFYEMA